MPRDFVPPSPEAVAELRRFAERRLTPEEFEAYVRAPMSDQEREDILATRDWYMRRYPTVFDRFAHARRAYERALSRMPPSADDPPPRRRG